MEKYLVLKKALTSILLLLVTLQIQVNAQQIAHTSHSGLKMGFGLGSSWQSSDIKNSKGVGGDIWIGTPVFQRENAFFALDWRFHFLAGSNSAYDHRINTDGSYNNVQLRHFNYDLEMLLTLNRLREKTGIILGGFLGAGLTHALVSADLLDASNNPYDYSSILPGQDRSDILADLDQLCDQEFETRMHSKASLLPTAGLYLGYQFSSRFALGVEHKMNFSLSEHNSFFGIDLDNQVSEGSGLDWNNYTSLVFRFALKGKSGKKESKADPAPVPSAVAFPPQVDIAVPYDNPHITAESEIKVSARIFNITQKTDITVLLNGQNQNFQFYNSLNSLEITTYLQPGSNSLEISCRNEAGSARDQVELIFSRQEEIVSETLAPEEVVIGITLPEEGYPPKVKILSPTDRVANYNASAAEIVAEITHIDAPGDISVSINGIKTSAFSYNAGTNSLSAIVPLNSGTNRLNIEARNIYGSDSDQRTLVRESMAYLPTTQLITNQPVQDLISVQEPSRPVTADPTQPVNTGARQAVIVDPKRPVSADPNPPVNTTVRQPVIVDPKGSASDNARRPVTRNPGNPAPTEPPNPVTSYPSTPVTYNPPTPVAPVAPPSPVSPNPPSPVTPGPPTPVTPGQPSPVTPDPPPNPVTPEPCQPPKVGLNVSAVSSSSATHVVSARIQEVDRRESVSLTVNGSSVSNFNFNPNSEVFSANLKLNPGTNTIVIVATNDCGEDRASKTVTVQSQGSTDPVGTDNEQGWVRINPGNASWEFCLQTGSRTYTRSDLSNSGFSYSGAASSIYFKPIAGGGSALVNGNAYSLNPGQYYLFTGSLNIMVTNKRQGAMGHWSVYIESSSSPSTGKGKNRPQSPCDSGSKKPGK